MLPKEPELNEATPRMPRIREWRGLARGRRKRWPLRRSNLVLFETIKQMQAVASSLPLFNAQAHHNLGAKQGAQLGRQQAPPRAGWGR